jgi:hypothetical protein
MMTRVGQGMTTTTTRPRGYVLEDRAGYPIECPLCGQADRWQLRADSLEFIPRAFVCVHAAAVGAAGLTRQVASVSIDQVGRYLDLDDLTPEAA